MYVPTRSITLPFNWNPRPYQLPFFAAMDSGKRRSSLMWHRRSGKDNAAINFTAKQTQVEIGTYWHMLPTLKQGRRVVWDNIDMDGRRLIDQAFPKEIRKGAPKNDEMRIDLQSGSNWYTVGSDNYDAVVGSNPRGVVFSEFSLSDPAAWHYVRPILAANGGWAVFIFTPRGKDNHAYQQHLKGLGQDHWFCQTLTVDDTKIIPQSILDEERREMPPELFAQEYYCSVEASNVGSVYGPYMTKLEAEGRIEKLAWDPRYPVETYWDLGWADATVIWFVQRIGKDICAIDYMSARGKPMTWFFGEVRQKPYSYSRHIAPHDIEQTNRDDGVSHKQFAINHGFNFIVAPKLSTAAGIEATRAMLPRMRFDAEKCEHGLKALRSYHFKWDEEKGILSKEPHHDWSSDPCDALRTGAVVPEMYGAIPEWAIPLVRGQGTPGMGHNGGPPLTADPADSYDPLASYRG